MRILKRNKIKLKERFKFMKNKNDEGIVLGKEMSNFNRILGL